LLTKIHKAFNVKVALAEIFKTPTIRGLARFIRESAQDRYAAIGPVEKRDYYVLSSAQERMYILQQMEPQSTAYNMPRAIPLAQAPDLGKLESTFKALIRRHESLRTSFVMVDDQPVQRVHDEVEFEIAEIRDEGLGISPSAFDLSQAPLLRVGVVKTGENRHLLLLDIHHIITDGVSQMFLTRDFQSLYSGETLVPLTLQYKDYSEWLNRDEQLEAVKSQEAFWLEEFAEEIPVLHLPTDFVRPVIHGFEGASINFEIGIEESKALDRLAMRESATMYMVLLTIYTVLMSKLSGQEDIVAGTPTAGRRHADLERVIGMFVNTLALRNRPVGESRFTEFLGSVKEKTLKAFENQEYPFEELVEKVDVHRDAGRNPLFDVMFVFQNIGDGSGDEPVTVDEEAVSRLGTSNFDFTLVGGESAGGLFFVAQYSTNLFESSTIRRFIGYFKKIVSLVTADPWVMLKEIEIISEEEKRRVLYEFNNRESAYPASKTIHRLFEEQAAAAPHRAAIVGTVFEMSGAPVSAVTYGELNRKSVQLSHLLREKGVEPDSIVGLMVEPCVEMFVGMLAVLKAGGAYLPIDPGYPEERTQFMLSDSGASILLNGMRELNALSGNIEVIDLTSAPVCGPQPESPLRAAGTSDLAYIIYTSGTTGKPKGVMVEHGNVYAYLFAFYREFEIKAEDAVIQLASYAFDVFVEEVYPILFRGGKVIVPTAGEMMDLEMLARLIARHQVTILDCTPLLLNEFNRIGETSAGEDSLASLRTIISGGDVLKREYVDNLVRTGEVYNTYGPTESTVCASYYNYSRALRDDVPRSTTSIPIGSPITNYNVYILDACGAVVPIGVPGELCVSGPGVTRGYLNRPELTAEKFNRSYRSHKTYNLYRTGDLACWLPDGNIEFLGRKDRQVKIRGFRIETGEIESRISVHAGVKEALVIARESSDGDKYLCAYVVGAAVDGTRLREHLSKDLPGFMIPSFFVPIEQIPLNPNGKVDRKALPVPEIEVGGEYTAPRNAIEESLVLIWAEVLGINSDKIGIDSNFFQLGGHSLRAVIIIARVHRELNVKVPLAEIFKTPTIRGLARFIRESAQERYAAIGPVEKRDYYVLSSAQ
ncbi:MAG: amino acid adenylation domain-containing protein, partial [bacterium]|nr:amino acid adenylation domain-containing protein [bacterium]